MTATAPLDGRRLADIRGPLPGPTVFVVGAIHGNEPAGLSVCSALARGLTLARGRLVGLLGNAAARDADRRFLDEDLNRTFRAERVSALRRGELSGLPATAELAEQRALLATWDAFSGSSRVLLDLHTFSGPGTPFAMAGPDPTSCALGRASGLSTLLGLERHLRGTMVELGALDACPVLAIEGGQHADPAAADTLTRAVLSVLSALDLGPRWDGDTVSGAAGTGAARPDGAGAAVLAAPADGPLLDIVHRHGLADGDGFRMRPGYANLMPVTAGEPVADDLRGPICAPMSGLMVMPLYQRSGDDGFFIACPRTP
jgi:hypothetical protein